MDAKEAIAAAKSYVSDIYADEQWTNLALEEIEHFAADGNWVITIAFSRPWSTPRTRAQEVLENLGAASPLRRSHKVITMASDGTVLTMENPEKTEMA